MRPTAPTATGAGHIREIDGLRGVAILAVVLHRFWPVTGPLGRYAKIVELGWVGVDLFFVISGFLVAGILLDTKSDHHFLRNFFARRGLRILPLYYAYTGLVFAVMPLLQAGHYADTAFIVASGSPLWYLLFLGNFPEALGRDPPFLVGHLWSLAIEEQFYLSFPFVVLAFGHRRLLQVLVGAMVLAPLFRLAGWAVYPAQERLQYLATPCRMDSLAAGCILAVLVRRKFHRPALTKLAPRAMLGAVTVAIVAVASGSLARTGNFGRVLGYSMIAISFAGLLLFALARRGARSTAILRVAPLAYLGRICYASYLLHRPVGVVVDKVAFQVGTDGLLPSVTTILAKVLLTVAVASVSWHFFERPILALKRHFESRASAGSHDELVSASAASVTSDPLPSTPAS